MSIVLGIDGGGTKTFCAVGNDSSIMGSAVTGGSNFLRNEAEARTNLQDAIIQGCAAAHVKPANVEAACLGLAGAGGMELQEKVVRTVRELLPHAAIKVVGDMVVALEASLGSKPGIIVIAGTGSIAYGRDGQGKTERTGGLGPPTSDEGSGYWIGREAVVAVLQEVTSSHGSSLLRAILKQWNLASAVELAGYTKNALPARFAELFPVVLHASEHGDLFAKQLLFCAGTELSHLAVGILEKLWTSNQTVRVAIAGSIFAHSSEVRWSFYHQIKLAWPKSAISFHVVEPLFGALQLARQMVGEKQVARI